MAKFEIKGWHIAVVLVVAIFFAMGGKIPSIGPTTTPPTTTVAPGALIPPGEVPMDFNLWTFDYNPDPSRYTDEEAPTTLDYYVFTFNPLTYTPSGNVYCAHDVIEDAIDAKAYETTANNTSGWTEVISASDIMNYVDKGVDTIWIVLWEPNWQNSTYASVTFWWDMFSMPIEDVVKTVNEQYAGSEPAYKCEKYSGARSRDYTIKPIGDATVSTSTSGGTYTATITWDSVDDTSVHSNGVGEWIRWTDQPILGILHMDNFESGTDSVDSIKYEGKELTWSDIQGSGYWYFFITESELGNDDDFSVSIGDLTVDYTLDSDNNEQFDLYLYAGGFAGGWFGKEMGDYTFIKEANINSASYRVLEFTSDENCDIYG